MKKLFLFIIVLTAYSCSNKHNTSVKMDHEKKYEEIFVDTKKIEKQIDISDRIDNIFIVPVKESDGKNIEAVDAVLRHKTNYILVDKYRSKRALLFDSTGKYMRDLMHLKSFQVNDCWLYPNGDVGVYDLVNSKIFILDDNYMVKNDISVNREAAYKSVLPLYNSDKYVAISRLNPYNLAVLDRDLNPERMYLKNDRHQKDISQPSFPLLQVNGKIQHQDYRDEHIYGIDSSGAVSSHYKLLYSEGGIDKKSANYRIREYLSAVLKTDGVYDIDSLFRNNNYFTGNTFVTENSIFMMSRGLNESYFSSMYDPGSKECLSAYQFYDAKRKMAIPLFTTTASLDNNTLATVLSPSALKNIFMGGKGEATPRFEEGYGKYILLVKFK
jgi:hypothetical protein